ncbi:MAG: class I SAM-dependent methyltransferase [Acidobacteria bacterium]|nr:class I SAM-dependent methyltransferase [Acidobacteriota bacterium]
MDQINKAAYARADVVGEYVGADGLFETERVLLARLAPALRGKPLLDVGVGAGRTTRHLLEISDDYTGIDYTPALVEAARRKFPRARLLCRDARDLSPFADESFDFALFSFNGIDYVPHEERLQVLREVRRVLKPGGYFMFSSHNRECEHFNKMPWQTKPRLSAPYVKYCLYCLAHLPKHLRMRRHEVHADEYAVVNDNAHGFSLLAYYISAPAQLEQLRRAGFSSAEAYDMDGHPTARDTRHPWVYYLARK